MCLATWRTTTNVFPHSRERQSCRLGCSAVEVYSQSNEWSGCNGCSLSGEGKALCGEECRWQNALDGRASDVHWISALTCLTILCMNMVTFSLVVFARSLRAKYSSSNLRNMSLQILACLGLFSCAKLSLQSSTWCSQHKFTLLTS